MTRKLEDTLITDAITCYRDGNTVTDIAASLGVGRNALARGMRRHGVYTGNCRTDINTADLVSAYKQGQSILALSRHFGIARTSIRERLVNAGIQIRGRSSANRIAASRQSRRERKRRASAANNSLRGRKNQHRTQSGITNAIADAIRRAPLRIYSGHSAAKSKERSKQFAGRGESEFRGMLLQRGHQTVPQFAFRKYNIDLAIPHSIAVEISIRPHGMNPPPEMVERTKHLLNCGWNVIYVIASHASEIRPSAADYVAGFIDHANRNPTIRSQYRVIRGSGEDITADCDDTYHIP